MDLRVLAGPGARATGSSCHHSASPLPPPPASCSSPGQLVAAGTTVLPLSGLFSFFFSSLLTLGFPALFPP